MQIAALVLSLAAAARIDSIVPAEGPIGGGTVVTIRGSGFAGQTVRIDRKPVTPIAHTDGEVQVPMPAHANGYGVISIGNAFTEFLYLPPRLDELAPGAITTIAGAGLHMRDYGPAKNATIAPGGITVAADGSLYVAEPGHEKVTRVTTSGTIERVAGIGTFNAAQGPGDGGPATEAQISFPLNVAADPAGNVYIPDHTYRIRRVDAQTGIITTIAGDGRLGFSGDGGPAKNARIGVPSFAVADATDLFFIDFDAMRIRRIHFADGRISTFAGNGVRGFSGDGGPATQASFDVGTNSDFGALALDSGGNLYLGDSGNARVRRIDRATGIITTVVGPIGPADPANVAEIRGLAIHRNGNIFYSGSAIVETTPAGSVVRVFRSNGRALHDGAPVADAYFRHVVGLAFDASDDLLFSDSFGRIFLLEMQTLTVSTIAGIAPTLIAEHGPALAAPIGPNGLALDGDALLFADGNRIRRIDPDGTMTTIAGNGLLTFPQTDVAAIDAPLAPQSIELGDDGTLDVTDATAVQRIDASGFLRPFAGRSPQCGYTGDGSPARDAMLCQPWATVRDRDGNVFIADTNNNRIRRVDARTNVITTIAGNGGPVSGHEGYFRGTLCGDGGPALGACLNTPQGLALDSTGALYVFDRGNRLVRRIDAAGTITTFATGELAALHVDAFDRLHANDGARIVRFERDGTMTVLAGNGQIGFGGDGGPARNAQLNRFSPSAGMLIDREGNILFSDSGNRRIRAIRYGAVLAPDGATIVLSRDGSRVRAVVRDGSGKPARGVRVAFTSPASGASCRFTSDAALTDANGGAETSCLPNCTPGAYTITARPAGSSKTATAGMSNTNDSCRRRTVRH